MCAALSVYFPCFLLGEGSGDAATVPIYECRVFVLFTRNFLPKVFLFATFTRRGLQLSKHKSMPISGKCVKNLCWERVLPHTVKNGSRTACVVLRLTRKDGSYTSHKEEISSPCIIQLLVRASHLRARGLRKGTVTPLHDTSKERNHDTSPRAEQLGWCVCASVRVHEHTDHLSWYSKLLPSIWKKEPALCCFFFPLSEKHASDRNLLILEHE